MSKPILPSAEIKERAAIEFARRLALLPSNLAKLVETAPSRHRHKYLTALVGEASPLQSIKAKCFDCCGFEDLEVQVGQCKARSCPIWHHRPFQNKEALDSPDEQE